jgi:acetolactate synthase regulatory subunit
MLQAFEVTVRGRREPHILSRMVRVLAWQGVPVREMHLRTDTETVTLLLTVECDDWRATRLLVHFKRIQGVDQVEAIDAETGAIPQPTLLAAPPAR